MGVIKCYKIFKNNLFCRTSVNGFFLMSYQAGYPEIVFLKL